MVSDNLTSCSAPLVSSALKTLSFLKNEKGAEKNVIQQIFPSELRAGIKVLIQSVGVFVQSTTSKWVGGAGGRENIEKLFSNEEKNVTWCVCLKNFEGV